MSSATNPAPILRATRVERSPDDAFRVFTDEIGAWWPLPSHGVFGATSGGLAFVDGRLVEMSTDGREAVWGEVVAWEPPHRLTFTWHPGQSAEVASIVDVEFAPDGPGTRVVLEHRGWEAHGPESFIRRRHYVGPGAWGHVLDHFADGAEPTTDGSDVSSLAAAYGRFFAEATAGGFGPAPDGEWSAEQTIAHVALTDAAMLAVCHGIIHGHAVRFENDVCQDREVLAAWIDRHGDTQGLISAGRRVSSQLIAALKRLPAEQLAHEVHCKLSHDGQVMVGGPRPWGAIAIDVQAEMHLAAHTSQLADLRP